MGNGVGAADGVPARLTALSSLQTKLYLRGQRFEEAEESLISLWCEQLRWSMELQHRDARLRELRCARSFSHVQGRQPPRISAELALVRPLISRHSSLVTRCT